MFHTNRTRARSITGLALLCVAGYSAPLLADATLVYQTETDKGVSSQHTFAIRGRFVRVDTDTQPERYWVIDTGLLTRADVDVAGQRYTFEKLPRGRVPSAAGAAQPAVAAAAQGEQQSTPASVPDAVPMLAPEPVLAATRKKQNIAQVLCRMVNEERNGATIAEHCMAGTGPLGLNSREMITLSRLFTVARRLQLGWVGTATADERIASVMSRLQDGTASQTLVSVSYDTIPDERMQVPKRYRRVTSLRSETGTAVPEPATSGNDGESQQAGGS